ncbi:MAG: polysaccharide deacetylase family protein [Alphaproteobacteria bacterium]|nr:polysaccharide deacetylase family protein [Alphaproteobacteria bacterium]
MTRTFLFVFAVCLAAVTTARAGIVTRLPTEERVVALTFDACESGKVMHLDHAIVDWLTARRIPFTVFAGGQFARDNADDMKALAALPFVGIENHSWSHRNHMPRLSDEKVREEVLKAESEIEAVSGRRTRFFRFPAGNTDDRTTALVEALGYTIVHWRWPEGDPDKHVTAAGMERATLAQTQPGDILIFHVNGRGVHTAEAIPAIVEGLEAKGFRFVLLSDYLAPDTPAMFSGQPPEYP